MLNKFENNPLKDKAWICSDWKLAFEIQPNLRAIVNLRFADTSVLTNSFAIQLGTAEYFSGIMKDDILMLLQ